MGLDAKFEQALLVLPFAHAHEDRHEHGEAGDHWSRNEGAARAPQYCWLAGDDENERQTEEHAEAIAHPPGRPIADEIVALNHTKQPEAADREARARGAEERRQHQKESNLARSVHGCWPADEMPQRRASDGGLHHRPESDHEG